MDEQKVEEIWVNVTEGAQITGYNREYVMKLAQRVWKTPEDERPIQIRRRTSGYELWLPDLIYYMNHTGHGPYGQRKSNQN